MGVDDLGLALRRFRIRARVNQAALADILGVSQSQVSRWESGRDRPRAHNADAIEALIWGRPDPQRAALVQLVETASAQLALFDHTHQLIAASRPLMTANGPLQRFGWVFDPHANAAFAPVFRQYLDVLKAPGGLVALEVLVPFTEGDAPWRARALKTIYPLDPQAVCVAELDFAPDPDRTVVVPGLRRVRPSRRASALAAGQAAALGL